MCDLEVVALATPDRKVEWVAQPDGGWNEAGGGGFRFVDGLTCAVEVRVETVVVRFCCPGVEVGDGPGLVDSRGIPLTSWLNSSSFDWECAYRVPRACNRSGSTSEEGQAAPTARQIFVTIVTNRFPTSVDS